MQKCIGKAYKCKCNATSKHILSIRVKGTVVYVPRFHRANVNTLISFQTVLHRLPLHPRAAFLFVCSGLQ